MITRRMLPKLALLPLTGVAALRAKLAPKAELATGAEILKSFDARDWARHFVAHVREVPGLAEDEETMTSWFANALMRGYDERSMQIERQIRELAAEIKNQ